MEPDATRKAALVERLAQLDEMVTRRCEESLETFVEESWKVIEPGSPFVKGWHLGAICAHLMAVLAGQIRMLVILIPPRMGKSTVTSVCLTPWAWIRRPELRFMFASYASGLSLELAVKSRHLIDSPWYRARWADRYTLTTDQNVKQSYENTQRGTRISTSVDGTITGRGGDILVIDDPHNMKQIHSEAERYTVRESFYRTTWHNRVNNEAVAGRVCIMQRGHPDDLAGYLIEIGYEPLVLPNEYDPKRSTVSSIGWRDPRTVAGALLCPARISAETTATLKRVSMSAYVAQYQQEPVPEVGRMFKVDKIIIEQAIPAGVRRWVRFWDVAGTEGGTGARTAGVKMGRDATGRFVIADVRKGRWSDLGVQRAIAQTATLDGRQVAIREEQEPGSSGKSVILARARSCMAGYDYQGRLATGSKVTRAHSFCTQVEAGNVVIVAPSDPRETQGQVVADLLDGGVGQAGTMTAGDVREFLDELRDFPHGLKDQVDAAAGAFNELITLSAPLDVTTGREERPLTKMEQAQRDAELADEAERVVADAIARDGVYWPGGR